MDKKYLNDEFDHFFEFPTDDRSQVSSVSAKLFAEHIAYPILMDNAQYESQIAELKRQLEETESMVAHWHHMAKFQQVQLAESQAREARLCEAMGKRIPERVIETLWQGAGISTYHPNGDQADKLHQFAASLIEEFRFRLPALQHDDTALKEYRDAVIEEFVGKFKRHVGGDGEFWMHELEDFYQNTKAP